MTTGHDIPNLRDLIIEFFDEEELRTLCQDLGVEYDSLRGEGKAGKTRELVAYLQRRSLIPRLVNRLLELRPAVHWQSAANALTIKPTTHRRSEKPPDEGQQSIQRQIAIVQRNLEYLEEQIARFGVAVPIHLLNERDYAIEQIKELERRLGSLD